MTSLDLYNAALIELNKLKAPSLLLEDYNYFINKAIQQYINLVYNRYDMNQQSTDDLRVLTARVILEERSDGNFFTLPSDYVHLLNCIVEFNSEVESNKCGSYIKTSRASARRATADIISSVMNNVYLQPSVKRPYYYLHYTEDPIVNNTDNSKLDYEEPGSRLANSSEVKLEILCGEGKYEPVKVYVDYIRAPKYIYLDHSDIISTVDNTPILEFPDYVCYEIVNLFTKLVMENLSDPRLQTNLLINNTIPSPTYTDSKK